MYTQPIRYRCLLYDIDLIGRTAFDLLFTNSKIVNLHSEYHVHDGENHSKHKSCSTLVFSFWIIIIIGFWAESARNHLIGILSISMGFPRASEPTQIKEITINRISSKIRFIKVILNWIICQRTYLCFIFGS